MLNLSQTNNLYVNRSKSRAPLTIWLAEWESIGRSPIPGGTLLVKAGHYYAARQAAKKHLRDVIVRSNRFVFTVRLADHDELEQLKAAATHLVLDVVMLNRLPQPDDKNFADESSADLQARPN